MSLLHHEAFWSWRASSRQLQLDYFMRWDADGGALEILEASLSLTFGLLAPAESDS